AREHRALDLLLEVELVDEAVQRLRALEDLVLADQAEHARARVGRRDARGLLGADVRDQHGHGGRQAEVGAGAARGGEVALGAAVLERARRALLDEALERAPRGGLALADRGRELLRGRGGAAL